MFAQDFQNLRDRNQDGDAARVDLADDLFRTVARHEDDDAREHGRDEGGHGLAEHMAEREKVQETDGEKGAAVFEIFLDFALHRDDVGDDVAVGDDDAFGLGGGAGGEDDLGDL